MDLYGTKYFYEDNTMKRRELKQLEKSYKLCLHMLLERYLKRVIKAGVIQDDKELDNYIDLIISNNDTTEALLISMGKDPDLAIDWFREELNAFKLGDLLIDTAKVHLIKK